jgi:AraC-like DNA-binding protein
MDDCFIRVDRHWTESRGLDRGAVVFSELPRGESPIRVRTRSIKYVLEGVERYEIDGRTYVVRPGEFLFVDAGVAARAVLAEPGTTRGLCIYLPPNAATPASAPVSVDPAVVRSFQMSSSIVPYGRLLGRVGRRLAREGALTPAAAQALIRRTMYEFDGLHSSLAAELMRVDAAKPATRRDILQRLYRARGWLHDHVDGPVTLAALATMAGMSQFHLARSFRAVFGVPPAQYHAELRIRMADRALRRGELSVGEAARRFGFSETSSFSRAFLRIAGISPGAAMRNRQPPLAPGLVAV